MPFQIKFPECGETQTVPDSAVGKTGRCNSFGTSFPVVRPGNAGEEKNQFADIRETYDNFGRMIGKLETAHLWNQKVVCGECIKQLPSLKPETSPPKPTSSLETSDKGLGWHFFKFPKGFAVTVLRAAQAT